MVNLRKMKLKNVKKMKKSLQIKISDIPLPQSKTKGARYTPHPKS